MKSRADEIVLDRASSSVGRQSGRRGIGWLPCIFGRSGFIWARPKCLWIGITKRFSGLPVNQVVNADYQTDTVAILDAKILSQRNCREKALIRLVELAELIARLP